LLIEAVGERIERDGLPRPICVMAGSNDIYPYFDAPVTGVPDDVRKAAEAADDFDSFTDDAAYGSKLAVPAPRYSSLLMTGIQRGRKRPALVLEETEEDLTERLAKLRGLHHGEDDSAPPANEPLPAGPAPILPDILPAASGASPLLTKKPSGHAWDFRDMLGETGDDDWGGADFGGEEEPFAGEPAPLPAPALAEQISPREIEHQSFTAEPRLPQAPAPAFAVQAPPQEIERAPFVAEPASPPIAEPVLARIDPPAEVVAEPFAGELPPPPQPEPPAPAAADPEPTEPEMPAAPGFVLLESNLQYRLNSLLAAQVLPQAHGARPAPTVLTAPLISLASPVISAPPSPEPPPVAVPLPPEPLPVAAPPESRLEPIPDSLLAPIPARAPLADAQPAPAPRPGLSIRDRMNARPQRTGLLARLAGWWRERKTGETGGRRPRH
jgi:hypothetical protein